MKFNLIVADPPWQMSDKLTMGGIKRGAASNYSVLSIDDICKIPIADISCEDAVLALWVPSSIINAGLKVMSSWGFAQKQTIIWIKTKKDILKIKDKILSINDFENLLSFGMGRIFRQCHEVVLLGIKGKIYSNVKNKSIRSVFFSSPTKHSAKPECLQDKLEKIFPDFTNRLELFSRRVRNGWQGAGLEYPQYPGEDILESISRLKDRIG